ncbi:MarR family transcriptional regulator [Streptomyces sp. VRA16 Mangrove soil]|uniref:MarR family transcriptional regulator n=1 Tax=Streptomyces sp. VRA16 Mangrove soil TaxID=2817434 RepID=UPI001A9D7A1C|nr:MarR family transcriptional regulator [Streptomyces sp. VRA16 Mangrove soil]MBO1335320.1 MarR family transcriptional regulator [Streptomyces sp. VRA16 Mangrove soil]
MGDGAADDIVALVVRQWQSVHPGLGTGPMELIGRINRCAALLQQAESTALRDAGPSRAEFDLLGAPRRTAVELTPGEPARETFSFGATATKRLRGPTGRGLVERRTDDRDRRVAPVRLTDAGRAVVDAVLTARPAFELDAVLPARPAFERTVLAGLDPDRLGGLATRLGELLVGLEGRGAARGF